MKYKALKSAAHNFGHSFASGLNWRGNDYVMSHLARAVVTSGEVELYVDLLSGRAQPTPLLEGPVQASVADYVRWFPDLLRSQRIEPAAVRVATMRVRFQPERRVDMNEGMGGWTIPFECVVSLTDDHGKVHQGRLVDHWAVDNFNVPPGWRRRLRWWLTDLRRAWHKYRLRHWAMWCQSGRLFLFLSSQSPANPLFRLRFNLSRRPLEDAIRMAPSSTPLATSAWVASSLSDASAQI